MRFYYTERGNPEVQGPVSESFLRALKNVEKFCPEGTEVWESYAEYFPKRNGVRNAVRIMCGVAFLAAGLFGIEMFASATTSRELIIGALLAGFGFIGCCVASAWE